MQNVQNFINRILRSFTYSIYFHAIHRSLFSYTTIDILSYMIQDSNRQTRYIKCSRGFRTNFAHVLYINDLLQSYNKNMKREVHIEPMFTFQSVVRLYRHKSDIDISLNLHPRITQTLRI